MRKKKKIVIILLTMLIIIVISIFGLYKTVDKYATKLGGNNSLDTKNYNTAVEIDCGANFILLFNKKSEITNILYLNSSSVSTLYNKNIENTNIEEAIKFIVESLNNENFFNNINEITLINYGNLSIFDNTVEEFNKNLGIYGISKKLVTTSKTLEDKISELNLTYKNNTEKDLKSLYYYSLDIINKYQKSTTQSQTINTQNMDNYALNIYNKLLIYGKEINEQSINQQGSIDITTINATDDYDNELYAEKESWYYIQNNLIYAYINFKYDNVNYEYCFRGSNLYEKGKC